MESQTEYREQYLKIIRRKRGVGRPAAKRIVERMDDKAVLAMLRDDGIDAIPTESEDEKINDDTPGE